MEDNTNNTQRFPPSLTLMDLVKIVAIVITITTAWGVFGTRLTILEKENQEQTTKGTKTEGTLDEQAKKLSRLESHQQDDEMLIDQLYIILKKQPPARRRD